MNYDVIIIGAGPGGIFAAYELMKEKPDCKVAVFEEGYSLEEKMSDRRQEDKELYQL